MATARPTMQREKSHRSYLRHRPFRIRHVERDEHRRETLCEIADPEARAVVTGGQPLGAEPRVLRDATGRWCRDARGKRLRPTQLLMKSELRCIAGEVDRGAVAVEEG